ncbi:MAG: glycoside hydrolase family 38 C-terminal domain-containing protein, partial [Cyanobacteria bacterium P01_F01_bin.86]
TTFDPHAWYSNPGEAPGRVRHASQESGVRSQESGGPPLPIPHHAPNLPVWRDELYLELHRGCYTTHADQKWFNHRCEQALVEAELFATLGKMQGVFDYPQATLERAWKQVLFNQFHDILPGTAIPEVFATANQTWQAAYQTVTAIRSEALAAIARYLPLPSPPSETAVPVLVFNSLNWERTDIVAVAMASLPVTAQSWGVFNPETKDWLTSQQSAYADSSDYPPGQLPEMEEEAAQLLFLATVPSVGYRVFWLVPDPAPIYPANPPTPGSEWQLENDFLRAVIDPTTGDLIELWEKAAQVNVVRSPAHQLQAFQDSGQYWDAWDIAPDYAEHPLPPAQLKSITWLEHGPLRQRLRVVRELGDSTLQQDYVLDRHLPYLKVATVADWHASQVVLKVAFPLTIEADHATFEIPFGAIARPTRSSDPHQQAKWEVPGLRWADLSDGQVGLSLLTDYKHGFDTQSQQLRLTLLKAPLWPDPMADRGCHAFSYALYPHSGDWRDGRTPHWAIAFDTPLRWVSVPGTEMRGEETWGEETHEEETHEEETHEEETHEEETHEEETQNFASLRGEASCAEVVRGAVSRGGASWGGASWGRASCAEVVWGEVSRGGVSCVGSFVSLGADEVHMAVLKPSEDDSDTYVLRCWDMYGEGATLKSETLWGTPIYERTDLLERAIALDAPEKLTPWQIATLKFSAYL